MDKHLLHELVEKVLLFSPGPLAKDYGFFVPRSNVSFDEALLRQAFARAMKLLEIV